MTRQITLSKITSQNLVQRIQYKMQGELKDLFQQTFRERFTIRGLFSYKFYRFKTNEKDHSTRLYVSAVQ